MITFEHVTKRYPDGTVAVDDLSLDCPSGQVTVLVGTSGCGKTTSLRMINRLVDPSAGRVLLDGEDVTQKDPAELRRGIGYVIQQGGLFPHRTVLDNIATVPRLLGTPKRQARRRAGELLELVGLTEAVGRRYPTQLSGGQQQRVGVARALAADPPVLLMDEPFSAVDPVVRGDLQRELLRLQAELHKTIVFVTHDIDEAIRVGDRIAVLRVGGQLVQVDSPERVLAAPAEPFVESFLGVDRGIRWLSFFTAKALPLTPPPVLRQNADPATVRSAADGSEDWILIVDDDDRPVGWVARRQLSAAATLPPVRPLGHTITLGQDSLRAALDATVLSPAAQAVAVDTDGRLVGVADQATVGRAINTAAGRA